MDGRDARYTPAHPQRGFDAVRDATDATKLYGRLSFDGALTRSPVWIIDLSAGLGDQRSNPGLTERVSFFRRYIKALAVNIVIFRLRHKT